MRARGMTYDTGFVRKGAISRDDLAPDSRPSTGARRRDRYAEGTQAVADET